MVLYSRYNLDNNSNYFDTFNLSPGCYIFELTDYDSIGEFCDGLNTDINMLPQFTETGGNIYFKRLNGSTIRAFEQDFGCSFRHQFTVGYRLGQGPDRDLCQFTTSIAANSSLAGSYLKLYPNPAGNTVNVQVPVKQSRN